MRRLLALLAAVLLCASVGARAQTIGGVTGAGAQNFPQLTLLPPPAATVASDQPQATGGSLYLAVANATGLVRTQQVTGHANIPPGDVSQAVSSFTAQVTFLTTSSSPSGAAVINSTNISTSTLQAGMQCQDKTPGHTGYIGPSNLVAPGGVVNGVSATLSANILTTIPSGDTIACDPVITLANATTAAVPTGTVLNFYTNNTTLTSSSTLVVKGDAAIFGNLIAPQFYLTSNFDFAGLPGMYVSKGNAGVGFSVGRATAGGQDVWDFRCLRRANYSGGTPGFGNHCFESTTIVSAGTTSSEDGALITLDDFGTLADGSLDSAVHVQAKKRTTANAFGGVTEVIDFNTTNTITGAPVAQELDVTANGTRATCDPCSPDPGGNRTGSNIVNLPLTNFGGNGNPQTVTWGLKIGNYQVGSPPVVQPGAITTAFVIAPSTYSTIMGTGGYTTSSLHGIDLAHNFSCHYCFESANFSMDGAAIGRLAALVSKAPAPPTVATAVAQASAGTVLAFPTVVGIAAGQAVSDGGVNIPAQDYVKSVLASPPTTVFARGISAAAQNVVTINLPAALTVLVNGPSVGLVCNDRTTPAAIGDGNSITAAGTPGQFTLHDPLNADTADGDIIDCWPTVTLKAATTGAVPASTSITFSNPANELITWDGTHHYAAGKLFDTNAFASPSNPIMATWNFGTAAPGTYTSEWDANGNVSVAQLAVGSTLTAPNLAASSAPTSGTYCWTTGTGNTTIDTALACLSSSELLKHIFGRFTGALWEIFKLDPIVYKWLPGTPKHDVDPGDHIGLGAFETAYVDERLIARDQDGNPRGWREDAMIALLVRGLQEMLFFLVALALAVIALSVYAVSIHRQHRDVLRRLAALERASSGKSGTDKLIGTAGDAYAGNWQ